MAGHKCMTDGVMANVGSLEVMLKNTIKYTKKPAEYLKKYIEANFY